MSFTLPTVGIARPIIPRLHVVGPTSTQRVSVDSMHLSAEVMAEFSGWMRSWGAAETTVRARLSLASNLAAEFSLLSVRPEQLATWLGNPSFQPWTRVTYFSHMRCLFDWLRRTGRRADDPTEGMRRPREPRRKPRPLTPSEVVRILSAATGHERTWVSLGLFAGLRSFEIAKFRGEDISVAELYVRGKGGKDAMLPTHPALWLLAQSYPSAGFWFPSTSQTGHVNATNLTTRVTRLFESVGVEGSTHRCRHTYGTNLLRGGANIRVVQELMRHESLATTAGYLRVEESERVAAIGALSA